MSNPFQPETAEDEPPPFTLPVTAQGQGGLVNSAAGAAGALAGWAITSLGKKVSLDLSPAQSSVLIYLIIPTARHC